MKDCEISLPRLLDSSGGTARWIRPNRVTIDLTVTPLSYASMELPVGEGLPARGYVELFTPMGSAGIFRVRSPQDAYGEDITTAELEHAIVEVGDYLVLADLDEMMAASTAMQTVFSHYRGSKWQLGSVSALGNTQIAVEADHVRVLEAMLALLDQCPDCMMAFDFSTSPWTVSVVKRGTTVTAEGRLSRNVNAAKVIYDDTELCTRAYYEIPTTGDAGTDNFPAFDVNERYGTGTYLVYGGKLYQLTADHAKGVSWANTSKTAVNDYPTTAWTYKDSGTASKYGLIERMVPTGGDYTASEATVTADRFIAKRKEPRVSVEISAEELSYVTGEAWDTFEIGKLFRLALTDYDVTVELNITGLSWGDVYGAPENVTVNLADEEDTAITFLHDIDASGGSGGGGGGARKQDAIWKEYRTKFEQDDYHFNLVAQRVNKAEEVLQQAGLYIDSNGVLVYADDNERQVGGRLQVQADKIGMVVGTTASGNYIKVAEISAAINADGTGTARINADHIYIGPISGTDTDYTEKTLDGTITAISSDFTTVNTLVARKIEASYITADRIRSLVDGGTFSSLATTSLTVGGVSYAPNAVLKSIRGVNNGNGTYTLYQKVMGGSESAVLTFERGDTDAAYNQGWNDCIDAATGAYYLSGYTNYNNGNSANLWKADSSVQGGFVVATGAARVWRYGGSSVYRYTLPDKK